MRQIGLSIYPDHSDNEANINYLMLGQKYGYTRLFMSMLEIQGGIEATQAKYKQIILAAKAMGYQVFIDVNPRIFAQLQIKPTELAFFATLGVTGIRLDMGFDGATEARLTYNDQGLIIQLNETNDVDYLTNIMTYRPASDFLSGCHNFYPQRGTGIDEAYFERCSRRFRRFNLRSAAFISSHQGTIGPWDVADGLPTMEIDRDLPIAVQAKHLFATNWVDDVLIGNAYASETELAAVAKVNRYQPELTVVLAPQASTLERQIVLKTQHERRGDINTQTVRSTAPRTTYAGQATPCRDHEGEFQRGDVVIGNADFGVYANELQIVLQPHYDARKNYVGHIAEDELLLLAYLKPWTKFRLIAG